MMKSLNHLLIGYANYKMAKAANTVVTGAIQETEWFGTKPDVFTTSTIYDFVFDDDTGFAN